MFTIGPIEKTKTLLHTFNPGDIVRTKSIKEISSRFTNESVVRKKPNSREYYKIFRTWASLEDLRESKFEIQIHKSTYSYIGYNFEQLLVIENLLVDCSSGDEDIYTYNEYTSPEPVVKSSEWCRVLSMGTTFWIRSNYLEITVPDIHYSEYQMESSYVKIEL